MSATIINLIIQLIACAVGGNAAGAASKDVNLGTLGNTIADATCAFNRVNYPESRVGLVPSQWVATHP
jgi:hypothetical protein